MGKRYVHSVFSYGIHVSLLLVMILMAADLYAMGSAKRDPLVYTRQLRLATPIVQAGYPSIDEGANWQRWYDAGMPNRFTEADVVIDYRNGKIDTVFSCEKSATICAAHDARVSPDARYIAFTVAYGSALHAVRAYEGPLLPKIEFYAERFDIMLYNVATKTVTLLERDARMPDWPSNTSLIFTSSRDQEYPAWSHDGPYYQFPMLQVYEADIVKGQLANRRNMTPHGFAMNPVVLTNGWRCYSIYEGYWPRILGTPNNNWWIECYAANGTQYRVIFNAHGSPTLMTADHLNGIVDQSRRGVGSTQLRVSRPLSEIKPGVLVVNNYYRTEHVGPFGMGIAFPIPEHESEGFSESRRILESEYKSDQPGSGRYVPQVFMLTPFGTDGDDALRWDINGKVMGKTAWFAPSPEGEYIYTWCDGQCYEATLPHQATRAYMGGGPTAHKQIMLARVKRVTNPRDPTQTKVIACADEKWNCFDARYLLPRRDLLGQEEPPAPAPRPTGTTTTLRVVNAREGELVPIPGPNTKPTDKCALQGCAEPGWQARIMALEITQIFPWKAVPARRGFASTRVVATCPLEEDGSVECVIPGGIEYQMRGIDQDGLPVATDHKVHPAVPGETVYCHGCHDGHSHERVYLFGGIKPEIRWMTTDAAMRAARL